MSHISISPSLSHVSPIFAVSVRRIFLDFDVYILAGVTCPKSAGHAHLRTSAVESGYLADPTYSTGYMSPSSSTRPLLWTVTRRPSTIRTTIASLTSRKPHARTLDSSVFPQCLKPLFRTFLMVILLFREKAKKAGNRCKTERKRGKRRFCDQCCTVGVREKSTEQY